MIGRLIPLVACVLCCAAATEARTLVSQVVVNTTWLVGDTSPNYVSVTVDTHNACGLWNPIMTQPVIVQLAKNLGAAYLRIGGTDADRTLFGNNATQGVATGVTAEPPPCFMTPQNYDILNQFAVQAGWQIVFGLDALNRKAGGAWNSSNARQLFEYTQQQRYKVAGWELGNEPDLYPRIFGTVVTPHQMSQDFAALQQLIKDVFGDAGADMQVFGPDAANPTTKPWFDQFLGNVTNGVLSRVTVHFYYFNSQTAKLDMYLNATILDTLATFVNAVSANVRKHLPSTRLWIGETSNSYNHGKPGVSDSYAVTPMWIDKLGLAGRLGIDGLMKQDYFGYNYGLLSPSLQPTPVYWASVIFKRIAGTRVLSVLDDTKPGRTVRSYARCAAEGNGAVLIMIASIEPTPVTVQFPQFSAGTRDQYVFSEGIAGNVTSATIQLNGAVLLPNADGSAPPLMPVSVAANADLTLSPYGTAFLVVHDAKAAACL